MNQESISLQSLHRALIQLTITKAQMSSDGDVGHDVNQLPTQLE